MYFFGDDESKLGEYTWYAQNSGARPPNKDGYFGYDRFDWLGKWHNNYYGSPTDGSSWESEDISFRIFRVGGWDTFESA